MTWIKHSLLLSIAVAGTTSAAMAQYPSIPPEQQHAQDEKSRAADQRSDELFAKAKVQIDKEAANGKPYLPGASRPEDLPQAAIPAFPGAWGGGMYTFGGRGG